MAKRTYKVELYFDGNEDDAMSIRKSLAQTIADEFELAAVYGVEVSESRIGEHNGNLLI